MIPASGQGFAGLDDIDVGGTSYYRFVRPGEASMQLLLVGNTVATGIYVVGVETEFAELLALSGTATGTVSARERTTITVRLYRPSGVDRELIAETDILDVLTAPSQFPDLQDGDIVYVEAKSRPRLTIWEIIRNVSSVATLAFVVERLITGRRR